MIFQDNIHPPDLILHNPSSMPSVDSPLSTPPDSPRRVFSSGDLMGEEAKEEKEEEKKEEAKSEIVCDNDSLPDDEKNAPIGDELMTPTRTSEKENGFEAVRMKPVEVNAAGKLAIEDEHANDDHDEPPSLSILDEPPSLSRVQEAMQRTSRMVEKHNQRDRNSRSSILRDKPMSSTTATNVENAVKSSESKLEALQRDIMSLKSSLSDMNMNFKKDEAAKVDEYNDIPSTNILKKDASVTVETEPMLQDKSKDPKHSDVHRKPTEDKFDPEVAAITANYKKNLATTDDEQDPPSLSKNDATKTIPRKLDYGDMDDQPDDETMDELMGPSSPARNDQGVKSSYNYKDIQHEMKKFASQTREALRDQSFTDFVDDPSPKVVPATFSSPIAVERSMDDHTDFQMNAISQPRGAINISFAAVEAGEVPKMLISMDSFDGIASGDIFLSLLSENTGRDAASAAATWADRVHGAIWRARRMRKKSTRPKDPPSPRSRFNGGSQTVESVQKAALMHLKRNEIDEAIHLVEGIVFAYYSYFERSLNLREETATAGMSHGAIDFKPYIGMGLHNLGVLNLLKGDYDEALSYFTRAVENRRRNLGENHPHYISSLVRLSVCHYALNEFAEAHTGLEEALGCAKRNRSTTLEGRLQAAEILNNLGCLAYMSGQPTTASSYYRESMDIQFGALTDSLYLGNATSGQSISLNISIARANIGFIKLVTKELPTAITALENALMEQQILLKGLDDTLIATMDHLALSNLLDGSQEKAALMYNRILTLQQREYGPNDRRCFVTVEKMNMVQGKGIEYEGAIEQLSKTFLVQPASRSPQIEKPFKHQRSRSRGRKKKGALKTFFKTP